MKVEDHRLTGSWDNSRAAQDDRQSQAELIEGGDFALGSVEIQDSHLG
jgi:hypothetical protein